MSTDYDYDLAKYVGRPYENFNCLDLVKEFYLDVFNIKVDNYYDGPVPSPSEVQTLIASNKGEFVQVEMADVTFGDIVVIRLRGMDCHIGVFIEGGKFIHSAKTTGSNIDRLSRYRNMISGYYRHRKFLENE